MQYRILWDNVFQGRVHGRNEAEALEKALAANPGATREFLRVEPTGVNKTPRTATVDPATTKPTTKGIQAEVYDRTNKPGTCLWCGRKLRLYRHDDALDRFGDYGDNAFCGLRCGHAFGIAAAVNGMRFRGSGE